MVHKQVLLGNIQKYEEETQFYLSNVRTSNLAESIYRLSINDDQVATLFLNDAVKRSFFGLNESSFEYFMSSHWEVSPYLRRCSEDLNDQNDIFTSVLQSLCPDENSPFSPSSILESLVSCLPIASDELNILSCLKEVKNMLGCPIIYEQDIRVLKTVRHLKREVHLFNESSSSSIQAPKVFHVDDILKCEEAYNSGYTIALRGMECRFKSIASIADVLASLFGQPSVGANLYLTPPNSQGLTCHYDDHCVFVYQLLGSKQWRIYAQPTFQLPRLYEPIDNLHGSPADYSMTECQEILLREGDVLYIPRGFSHEACTVVDSCGLNGTIGFSLHLTLGIEIEPPFEWEGFIHVALHCWDRSQKELSCESVDSLSEALNIMSVNLLHAMIRLIGDSDPTFRKACLVGAISFQSDAKGWFDLYQKTNFSNFLDKINESTFLEALKGLEEAVKKNKDPFQQMRWLELLDQEGQLADVHCWNVQLTRIEILLSFIDLHKDAAQASFVQVKSKFCREMAFENVEESYRMLLGKYKKVRKQHMNGMLSLHCS